MTVDDRELMTEISAQAQIAEQGRPKVADVLALAIALQRDFPHRSVDEIHTKLKSVWRARGVSWSGD